MARKQPHIRCQYGHTETWDDIMVREKGWVKTFTCLHCLEVIYVKDPFAPKELPRRVSNNNPVSSTDSV
jgi:hypothetical protein